MKIGDNVKLIGIPPDVKGDDTELRTRTLFEKCLGRTFRIAGLETVDGLSSQLIRLDVGHVVGKHDYEETIWVEPEYIELGEFSDFPESRP